MFDVRSLPHPQVNNATARVITKKKPDPTVIATAGNGDLAASEWHTRLYWAFVVLFQRSM